MCDISDYVPEARERRMEKQATPSAPPADAARVGDTPLTPDELRALAVEVQHVDPDFEPYRRYASGLRALAAGMERETTLTEDMIAAAWDASDRNRPLSHQDDWRSTSFRQFARSFAREIERRVRASLADAPTDPEAR